MKLKCISLRIKNDFTGVPALKGRGRRRAGQGLKKPGKRGRLPISHEKVGELPGPGPAEEPARA